MKLLIVRFLLVFVFLSLNSNKLLAQNTLSFVCLGRKIIVPSFSDSYYTKLNNQYPVKAKIISPINLSDAPVEIRWYYTHPILGYVVILKCYADSCVATKYHWNDRTSKNSFLHPMNGSDLSFNNKDLFSSKQIKNISWSTLFQQLVNHNLFNMQDQEYITRDIIKNNPKVSLIENEGWFTWEIKLNDRFRTFEFRTNYVPDVNDNKNLNDYRTIQQLLQNIDL